MHTAHVFNKLPNVIKGKGSETPTYICTKIITYTSYMYAGLPMCRYRFLINCRLHYISSTSTLSSLSSVTGCTVYIVIRPRVSWKIRLISSASDALGGRAAAPAIVCYRDPYTFAGVANEYFRPASSPTFFQTCGESALTIWFHFSIHGYTNRDRLGTLYLLSKSHQSPNNREIHCNLVL
jgi:hypothetical protein